MCEKNARPMIAFCIMPLPPLPPLIQCWCKLRGLLRVQNKRSLLWFASLRCSLSTLPFGGPGVVLRCCAWVNASVFFALTGIDNGDAHAATSFYVCAPRPSSVFCFSFFRGPTFSPAPYLAWLVRSVARGDCIVVHGVSCVRWSKTLSCLRILFGWIVRNREIARGS